MPPPPPLRVAALSLGPEAAALRHAPVSGRVLAVLRAAVYLEAESGAILGLVGADAPDGPLTVRIADLTPLLPALHTRQDAPCHATPEALVIAGTIRIPWAQATCWTPTLPATIAPPPARAAAAHTLTDLLNENASEYSAAVITAPLVQTISPNTPLSLRGRGAGGESRSDAAPSAPGADPKRDPVQRRLQIHCTTLYTSWRTADTAAASAAAVCLLGLGPGLTPSGDDLLMGLLAALHWQARLGALASDPVAALTAAVLAAAPQRTTRLSARLLHYAAQGVLYEPATALGATLLAGDPASVPAPAARLCAIGHTSGMDLAVGLWLGTVLSL